MPGMRFKLNTIINNSVNPRLYRWYFNLLVEARLKVIDVTARRLEDINLILNDPDVPLKISLSCTMLKLSKL